MEASEESLLELFKAAASRYGWDRYPSIDACLEALLAESHQEADVPLTPPFKISDDASGVTMRQSSQRGGPVKRIDETGGAVEDLESVIHRLAEIDLSVSKTDNYDDTEPEINTYDDLQSRLDNWDGPQPEVVVAENSPDVVVVEDNDGSDSDGPVAPTARRRRRLIVPDSESDSDDDSTAEAEGKSARNNHHKPRRSTGAKQRKSRLVMSESDVSEAEEVLSEGRYGATSSEGSGDDLYDEDLLHTPPGEDPGQDDSLDGFIVDDEECEDSCYSTSEESGSYEDDSDSSGDDVPDSPSTPLRDTSNAPSQAHKTKLYTPKTPNTARNFARVREKLARQYYAEYNEVIFDNQLPADMAVTWSKKLNTTAGRTCLKRRGENYFASIELSTKVVDFEPRLRNTLCHEMCHAAAWIVNKTSNPPHGKVFKWWARVAMRKYPSLDIKTCHTYKINYKFQWRCVDCNEVYGRHSKSIDPLTQRCGRCNGQLDEMPRLKADGTPMKKRAPTAFSLYVKDNYSRFKRENPGSPHAEVMRCLGSEYKQRGPSASAAATPSKLRESYKPVPRFFLPE